MKGGLGCPPSPPGGKNPNHPPNWDKCAHFSKGHRFLLDRDIDLKLMGDIDQVENVFFSLVNFSIHAQGGARGPRVTFRFSSNLQKIVLSDFDDALHKVPLKLFKLQYIKKLAWTFIQGPSYGHFFIARIFIPAFQASSSYSFQPIHFKLAQNVDFNEGIKSYQYHFFMRPLFHTQKGQKLQKPLVADIHFYYIGKSFPLLHFRALE